MRNHRALRISVAIVSSLGVHFAAAMVAAPSAPPVMVEGGATAEIAMLGSSFEDLLQGSDRLAPAEPAPAKPAETRPVDEDEAAKPVDAELARPDETAQPEQAVVKPVAYRAGTTPVAPEVLTGTVPVTIQPAEKTEAAKTKETQTRSVAPEEAEPAKAVETATLTPSHAAGIVRAEPETQSIPVPMARPLQPDDKSNLAKAREAQQRKNAERTQVANVARGNADRNASAGSAQGRAESKAKSGGSENGGKAKKAGNAKASNYPGKVYSKIRRTRQKRAGGTGVARVRFSIATNGALASVRIAGSSGSSSVDSVAVDHIRRSAPFPPPPAGAKRQFVIPVEVRR